MHRITYPGGDPDVDFLVWREGSGGTVEIFDIQVGSERCKGRGRKLVETLFNSLSLNTRVFAITRSDNETAQKFYERLRFCVVGVLRQFYSQPKGVDAIMYGRRAGGPV
jgi:ribosomal protein S18 acetylase RimI-like enzyme